MTKDTTPGLDALTKQNIAQALWMKEYDESKIPADLLKQIKSDKNSNAGYGARFLKRLQHLIDNQLSFVNPRIDRYQFLLKNSENLSPQQFYTRNLMLGPECSVGYLPIPQAPVFDFPAIDAPQLKNQTGWHFFVGNFTDEQKNHYSVEMMFWQYALLPPDMAASMGLSDLENQSMEVHLAICDPQKQKQYRAATPVVAGTSGLLHFSDNPYTYRIGKNTIQGHDVVTKADGTIDSGKKASMFPLTLSARGYDMSDKDNIEEIEINITLDSIKGIFLQGDRGSAPSVDGVGTLYYSAAQLQLKPGFESAITINGNAITLTDGRAWYDHQWGTGFMPNGAPQHPVMRALQNTQDKAPGGWDWFMFQFYKNDKISKDGEVQITASAIHDLKHMAFYYQTGPTPPGVMSIAFSAKYIDPENVVTELKGTMKVPEWVKITESPEPDVYPATNTWYPAKYEFTVDGGVPEILKTFTVTPLIKSGQAGFFGNGLQYIEGGAVITDASGTEIGRGFTEGTNWANCNPGVVALAGLPVNDTTIALMKAPQPTFGMKVLSYIWVLLRGAELKKIFEEARGL